MFNKRALIISMATAMQVGRMSDFMACRPVNKPNKRFFNKFRTGLISVAFLLLITIQPVLASAGAL